MSNIGLFVHTYHIWGLFGLLTALIWARANHRMWRANGGTFKSAPSEWGGLIWHHFTLVFKDLGLLAKAALYRFTGADLVWPTEPKSPWKYEAEHSLMFGIMLGGLARFATAFYWAEKNTAWMTEDNVWVPAIPIIFAIFADIAHQITAWPQHKHRVRLLTLFALIWIILGGFLYV